MKLSVTERLDSCEIRITSKGLFSGGVKVYDESVSLAVDMAMQQSQRLEEFIRLKNNIPSGDDIDVSSKKPSRNRETG